MVENSDLKKKQKNKKKPWTSIILEKKCSQRIGEKYHVKKKQ